MPPRPAARTPLFRKTASHRALARWREKRRCLHRGTHMRQSAFCRNHREPSKKRAPPQAPRPSPHREPARGVPAWRCRPARASQWAFKRPPRPVGMGHDYYFARVSRFPGRHSRHGPRAASRRPDRGGRTRTIRHDLFDTARFSCRREWLRRALPIRRRVHGWAVAARRRRCAQTSQIACLGTA